MSASASLAHRLRTAGRPAATLGVLACLVLLSALGTAAPAAAATAWGASGATYDGGIVCQLPGATTVPMSRWAVDGTDVFSTGDVVKVGAAYGSAPTSGARSTMRPGQAGLDAGEIAAAAYLITHHGTGSPAEVAETSADLALAAGDGRTQSRCLGQQGTSTAHARALWTDAQRYAGPYRVSVTRAGHAKPGTSAEVTATVVSASGAPTPGIPVTISAGTNSAAATTDGSGVAAASVVVPSSATTPIRATASAPIGLTYIASNPPSVLAAAPTTSTGTGTLAAVLHPHPTVTVSAAQQLVLQHATTSLTAAVADTYGYRGAGTIKLVGPVQPRAGQSCSSVAAADFAHAPTAWTNTFDFVGDATVPAGRTSALAKGCYASRASLTTTDSTPAATADSGYPAAGTVTVSAVRITTSTGSGIAPPGPLAATVAADDAGSAKVSSTVTTYGPIVTGDGQCDSSLTWSAAPVAAATTTVDLTHSASATNAAATSGATTSPPGSSGRSPGSGPASSTAANPAGRALPNSVGEVALGAQIATPRVARTGCYAFATRSTVSEDGHTLVVQEPVGSKGSTVLVMRPRLAITDGTFDGQQGTAMSGQVSVVGAYRYGGVLTVGLTSAAPTAFGCGSARFTTATGDQANATRTTTVRVSGDGQFTFRTPIAPNNVCYAVTATLALDANHDVQAPSPNPTQSSVFLAGAVMDGISSHAPRAGRADGMRQPLIATIGAGVLLLVVTIVVIGIGIGARGRRYY